MDYQKELSALIDAFGTSGREDAVRSTIKNQIEPYADEIRTDAMGNLIIHKAGPGKKLMFSAHMDIAGFVITFIEKDGCLRFHMMGHYNSEQLTGQAVRFENNMPGLIVPGKIPVKSVSDLKIDIGRISRNEAEKLVQPGDTCVLKTLSFRNGTTYFSNGLDGRAGCFAIINALRSINAPANDLYFVFSCQEEVGIRGIKPAAFSVNPDISIAVGATGTVDSVDDHRFSAKLNYGVGIQLMTDHLICHNEVVTWMNDTALENNIPVQRDINDLPSAAGELQRTAGGVYVGGIGIPCRYLHTPIEACSLNDIRAAAQLIAALSEKEFPAL